MGKDAHNYERIARKAVATIDVPPDLQDWRDELEGAAMLGIAEALKGKGAHRDQAAYLHKAARNAAVDELRAETRRRGHVMTRDHNRVTLARKVNADAYELADVACESGEPDPPKALELEELIERVRRGVDSLPHAHKQAMVLTYGVLGHPPVSTTVAASKMRVSRQRVRELVGEALDMLGRSLGVTEDEVAQAMHPKRTHGNPRPGTPTGTSA